MWALEHLGSLLHHPIALLVAALLLPHSPGWLCLLPSVSLSSCPGFLASLTSWNLCWTFSFTFTAPNIAFPGADRDSDPATQDMASCEIWVEASMTPQVLHSTCLQTQHCVDDATVCWQLEQYLIPLEAWLQQPLSVWMNEHSKRLPRELLSEHGALGSSAQQSLSKEFTHLHLGACDGCGLAKLWETLKSSFLFSQCKALDFFFFLTVLIFSATTACLASTSYVLLFWPN